MSNILRLVALVAFIVAAVISMIVTGPDVLDVLAAISIGLAAWVGSTLTP